MSLINGCLLLLALAALMALTDTAMTALMTALMTLP
jgi:hypothetical protein